MLGSRGGGGFAEHGDGECEVRPSESRVFAVPFVGFNSASDL